MELILRQARERDRARFLRELAELFGELQSSFEESLRIRWEIGTKLIKEMEAEEFGNKVRFIRLVARALSKSSASLYEYLRLAERWPDFEDLLASVRSHIDSSLAETPNALEKSDAERRMKTWRYVAHEILPTRSRPGKGKDALACALAEAPGHTCNGRVERVRLCADASHEFHTWLSEKRRASTV